MNRALRRISIAVLVMFVLLLININYVQGFEPASLAAKPNNARAFEAQFHYQRGSILTSDGVTVAESTPSNDIYKYLRKYPYGPEYAPVTGYDTLYSQSGIEYYENSVLNGSDSSLTVRNFIDLLTGKPRQGANVTLTINSKAQNAAWNALQSRTGRQGGRGGRAGPAERRDPGHGLVPELRPQRAGHPQRQPAQRGRQGAAQAGRQPAAEPGHRLHLAARLHVQDRDQLGVSDQEPRAATRRPASIRPPR